MNLTQIIEALPPQVYVRRGELVIHFSNPADLIGRLVETAGVLSDLERPDAKSERGGRRSIARSTTAEALGIAGTSPGEPEETPDRDARESAGSGQ